MNPNCKYEVHTYWGWFRLDEGAYQDYLAGKLWITWVPGKPNQSSPVGSDPVHVSDEALKYRELAARSDAYTVCYQFFATGKATVPYHSKMSDTPIDEMCLSVRSSNGLMRAGANTFGKVKEIMERENVNISSLSDTPDRKKSDTLTAKILHPFRIDGAWRPHGLRTAATPLDHSEIAFSRLMDSPLMVST